MALVIRGGKILLGHRHYKEISMWVCPGGRSEAGESLEETLRREVREEIGVNDLVIKEYLEKLAGTNAGDTVFTFLCEINQEEQLIEPDKFSEWKWFNKEQVASLQMSENTRKLISGLL
jgi:NAD+ diphosphatase